MAVSKKTRRRITLLLFAVYLVFLFYFLFFSEAMGRTGVTAEYRYNLTPLKEISRFIRYEQLLGWKAVLLNLGGNIFAFMPFGFLVPYILKKRKNLFFVTLYSFELSLVVELIQLTFKIGCFDVDDMILNTLGGFLGCLVYWLFEKIRSGKNGTKKKTA